MSTDFRLDQQIRMDELFDGRLAPLGINEQVVKGKTSPGQRCLTDSRHVLWVYGEECVYCVTAYAFNAPVKILRAIAKVFETDIFSEHEPQYWGFDTQDDWDHATRQWADESDSEFYADMIKYINDEPHNLLAGTVRMIQAEIAKDLVAASPDLNRPESKAELMKSVENIYEANHAVVIKLTSDDLAKVELMATHEDDMASA